MNENIYLNEETELSAYDNYTLMEENQNQQSLTGCSACGDIILNNDDDTSELYPPLDMMGVDYDSSETCPFFENQMCSAPNSSETCPFFENQMCNAPDSSETCPFFENQMCNASDSSETCKCTLESCPLDCKCSLDWHSNSK